MNIVAQQIDKTVLLSEDTLDDGHLIGALEEIDSKWYLGQHTEQEWHLAVEREVPFLLSISSAEAAGTTGRPGTVFRSRLLTLKNDCKVNVGRLNSETVKGLWASLTLELLYFTNDDDERYSIQAEERILRNLTVEAADPPLGYPVYTSPPIRLWT